MTLSLALTLDSYFVIGGDSTPGGSKMTYARPGGVFTYRRPAATTLYLRP